MKVREVIEKIRELERELNLVQREVRKTGFINFKDAQETSEYIGYLKNEIEKLLNMEVNDNV